MSQISVEEASRNLKKLLEQVATGEEVILVEQDRIVARESSTYRQRAVVK